ncbi:hypothetical protein V8C35DRAFT_60948 [Trichoderma chlorosporum]
MAGFILFAFIYLQLFFPRVGQRRTNFRFGADYTRKMGSSNPPTGRRMLGLAVEGLHTERGILPARHRSRQADVSDLDCRRPYISERG